MTEEQSRFLNPDYRLSGEPLPHMTTELRPEDEGTWRWPRMVTPEELKEIRKKRHEERNLCNGF